MIIYISHLSGKYTRKRKVTMYTGIMFQDFYIFRIHKNVFKVEQKLGVSVYNKKFLGLTTLVTLENCLYACR